MPCLQQATGWLDISLPQGQTMSSIKVAPPNSLVLISDVERGEVPAKIDLDGETMIKLGPATDVDPGSRPAFETILSTPTRTVAVMTIEWATLLKAEVPALSTRVRVWTNHARWPDKVLIGLG
jgi:hypothetical protein